jgi:hypothetical protein
MDANTTVLFHLALMIRTQNICCACHVTDLLADVSNIAPFSSFSSVSTPTYSLSSEYMTLLVGTVFHIFLKQRSHNLVHKQCGNDLVRALGVQHRQRHTKQPVVVIINHIIYACMLSNNLITQTKKIQVFWVVTPC